MPRKKLAELLEEQYEDEEVRAAVAKDIASRGTQERIEKGELGLPSEKDAVAWHERTKREEEQRKQREKEGQKDKPPDQPRTAIPQPGGRR